MWERSSSRLEEEPVEIPMYVIAGERSPASAAMFEPAEPADAAPAPTDRDDAVPAEGPASRPRQGNGAWPNGERAVRLGNAEEILITLPANPFEAMAAAQTLTSLDTPIPGLRIDRDEVRIGDFELVWPASLRAPIRWRAVTLRLYASPSLNVTVMTIVPAKARKISSRWFIRNGLRAAREFGAQIAGDIEGRRAAI